MNSFNTLKIGKRIDSPLSAFNNFIVEIGNEISTIFDYDVVETSNCIFLDESIILFNFVKIIYKNNKFEIQLLKNITSENVNILNVTLNNFEELTHIIFKYLFVLNDVNKNYDSTISHKYIDIVYERILKLKSFEEFLIPYKDKVYHEYEKPDETLINLYKKYSYVLTVTRYNKKFRCSLTRVLSSDLDENLSLDNIRPLEKEKLKSLCLEKTELKNFLINLMCYGEFE